MRSSPSKPDPLFPGPAGFAHRGRHGPFPFVENSLTAFAACLEMGAGVECDVRLTKDGEIVVFHDSNAARLTGHPAIIEQSTLAEVRRLPFADHPIPTLGELLAQEAKIKLVMVPYKGQTDALTDLLAGRVAMMPLTAALAMPNVKAGKLRALAVTTAQRASAMPDLPTVAESAPLPGYEVGTWFGLVAPAATPQAIRDQLAAEVHEIVEMPDVQAKLTHLGMEMNWQSPARFDAFVAKEFDKWTKVAKQAHWQMN